MKYLLIIGDGMADYPIEALGGKTPLAAARTPSMDRIARQGRNGTFRTLREDQPTGSAAANLSILGYDANQLFKSGEGRGVLEAASLGISLAPDDLVLRVNLISVEGGLLRSHSAGHIDSPEAHRLICDLQTYFQSWNLQLYPGLSYRHVLVVPEGEDALDCSPPHDHLDEPFEPLMIKPLSPGAVRTAEMLNRMVWESQLFLQNHPINQARQAAGKKPANSLWPWAQGKPPAIQTLQQRFGIKGATITAVDLIKGIALYTGMAVIPVSGATGFYNTNYEGKADAAIEALKRYDLVYLHVEAPDEAGHERDLRLKMRCIEDLDGRLIRRVLEGIEREGMEVTIALLPDHPTPVCHGAHTREPVPVAIWNPRWLPDEVTVYDEASATKGSLGLLQSDTFLKVLLNRPLA